MSDRSEAALKAVEERLNALFQLSDELQDASFEQGQPRLLRWADRTVVVLAREVSQAESQRFNELRTMREYFEYFGNELIVVRAAILEAPEYVLQGRSW